MRVDGRKADELRSLNIIPSFIRSVDGSVLIEIGNTRVICTASVEESVPPFMRDTNRGWVTAEYSMLPGSGSTRVQREAARGRIGGRTHEIQRLIGRSLRSVINMEALGSRTLWIDCDVIEADGGTRTASITGAYVALVLAVRKLMASGKVAKNPIVGSVAAVSAGIIDGTAMLDLCYREDSRADVDMNFVMTGEGGFVEVQGTAEAAPFSKTQLDRLTDLAWQGIQQLTGLQQKILSAPSL